MASDQPVRLLIITGLSGSGKTSTVHALEDIGFFCIDNLPILLLPGLLDLHQGGGRRIEKLAVVMDIRGGSFLQEYSGVFDKVRERGIRPEILFLEASTEALLRRFEMTCRPHPLGERGTLLEGIEQEKEQLSGLRRIADRVLDTSCFNIHEIRQHLNILYGTSERGKKNLQIELISFGYTKGLPFHVDLMMDVRFLPNPHYDPEFRDRDGRDPEVREIVRSDSESDKILERFLELVELLIDFYENQDRAYFVLGVGCTGGRHRSVAVVYILEERFRARGYVPKVLHRDIDMINDPE